MINYKNHKLTILVYIIYNNTVMPSSSQKLYHKTRILTFYTLLDFGNVFVIK